MNFINQLKALGLKILGYIISLCVLGFLFFAFIYMPIKLIPGMYKYFTEEREKPQIHYCTNQVYLMKYSDSEWYSYMDRSDECYECPSGATDYPYLLDGPFKSKEEGCNQYR